MTRSEKRHWIIIVVYSGLLVISVLVGPEHRIGGVDWNGLFQMFGPTVGTFVACMVTVMRMMSGRVSVFNGIGAILVLVVVSLGCMAITFPVMMTV